MNNMNSEITFCAVGDVRILNNDPKFLLSHIKPTISAADILFCQLESAYSNRGSQQQGIAFRAPPGGAAGLKDAGFDVISTAGNHCMDFGPDALLDTLDALKENGLLSVGTGRNLDEARKPVIIDHDGTKIGFIAFNSIMADGDWAEPDRAGCNAIRIYTQDGKFYSGETSKPRRSDIMASREDIAAMVDSVKKLKAEADIAIVSFHWGLSFSPIDLAPYQSEVGHAAIDAGADLVLGHHPHILKAVEEYKGKVIFYSIGNFAFDHNTALSANAQALYPGYKVEPGYEGYRFGVDSRKTIIVRCSIADKKIRKIAVLPTYINGKAQPQIVERDDARFDEVVDYLKRVSAHHGFAASYRIEGDEAIIWSQANIPETVS